ncbi:hypothetical protein [Streptomyces salinarius]|uniref:Uncharacterized protein n=1 Tax=Streptomyces salinarius TaxID=2762598 RepID=A0ABW8BLX2_9ACTN
MSAKKIVVADDYGLWAAEWARVLQDKRPGQYEVIPVDRPSAMGEQLDEDHDIWLLVIDMDFYRVTADTGLRALITAEAHARRRPADRPLHTIVSTVDDNDNRFLFLHTAFQCFNPPPVDLIFKDPGFDCAALSAVDALARGDRPAGDRFARFTRNGLDEPLIRRLLGGKCNTRGVPIKLALWQALAGISADPGDTVRGVQQLQAATGITSKHIYTYLNPALEVAQSLAADMRLPPRSVLDAPAPERREANDVLSGLREFAVLHMLFFQAPELPEIVKDRLIDRGRGK